jgi:AraC-like DNA-binding protein
MAGARLDTIVQIGGGGAGAATAFALLRLGVRRLILLDVAPEKAQSLASVLEQRFKSREVRAESNIEAALGDADGVLNATPVGMAKHPGTVVPAYLLRPALWVADIIYFPFETQLLRDARQAGCRTLDGGGMAVFQAARAFEIFTGRVADTERMRRPECGRRSCSAPVRKAQQRIDEDPSSQVSLAELAALSGVSRYQIVRAFARELGVTPYAYVIQRRVLLARQLLVHGTTLIDAALRAGFADQSHLTRAFVRQFGVPPGRYLTAGSLPVPCHTF